MYSLFTTPEKRQLKLVSLLIEHGGQCATNDLLQTLNVSASVLNNDVKALRTRCPNILMSVSDGMLILREFEGLNDFIVNKQFMRSLPEYRLLQLIFEERLDEDGMIEALDTSISTLNRMINRLNEVVLKEFDISIKKSTMRMEGEEKYIRNFYLSLFNELVILDDDSFFTMPVNLDVLDQLAEYFEIELDIGSFHTFRILFYINAVRTMQGHEVTYEHSKAEELYTRLLKPQDLIFLNQMSKRYFGLPCSPARFEQMFFPYAEHFFIPFQELLVQRFAEFSDLQDHYLAVKKAMYFLRDKYKLNYDGDFDALVLSVYNSLQLQTYQAKNIYVGYDRAAAFSDYIKRYFNHFFLDMFKHFYDVYELSKTELDYNKFLNNLTQILFFSWLHLAQQLTDPAFKLKVLVISSISTSHAYMIKYFVQRFFPSQTQVDVYEGLEIDYREINDQHYHAILTNFDLDGIENAEVIIYDNFPTYRSYYSVSKALERLNKHKILHG